MSPSSPRPTPPAPDEPRVEDVKIYVLPNLMTAGNLVCGFLAVLQIITGTLEKAQGDAGWMQTYEYSLYYILAACIFDLLDGRLARLGGRESPFGREFDSLADVVSFGVAPALMIFKIVLLEVGRLGWMIAILYLVCGALRLARFNVIATMNVHSSSKEFTGFPIPAAAGLISSITLLMLHLYERQSDFQAGYGKYGLAVLMVFLSFMMFSKFKYPSFKSFNWRTQRSMPKFLGIVLLLGFIIMWPKYMLPALFISYLLYGFLRPFISRALRREIEEEDEDDEEHAPTLEPTKVTVAPGAETKPIAPDKQDSTHG